MIFSFFLHKTKDKKLVTPLRHRDPKQHFLSMCVGRSLIAEDEDDDDDDFDDVEAERTRFFFFIHALMVSTIKDTESSACR